MNSYYLFIAWILGSRALIDRLQVWLHSEIFLVVLFLHCRVNQIHLMMTKMENVKSTSGWASMGRQPGLSWRKKTGREFPSTLSRAAAGCWVATGLESFFKKWKKVTHGAVCASRTITWDQKIPAKSIQRCSSEEVRSASCLLYTSPSPRDA